MIKQRLSVLVLCLALLCGPVFGQSWNSQNSQGIKAGLGVEYFQRTVTLGDEADTTAQMNNLNFNLGFDYQLQDSISVGLFAGYSLNSLDQIIFRELPFSLQLDEEKVSGVIAGARMTAGSLYISQFEIKGSGQFVYCFGLDQNWDIPGLAVSGTAAGKTDWMRASAGPVIYYAEPLVFSPYLAVQFNYLWGKFSMEEDIENLTGSEEKKIASKGYVSISAGGVTELTPGLELTANIDLIPAEGGIDLGLVLGIAYIF